MFSFFKKKKNVILEAAPCAHKWKDFNWYIEWSMRSTKDGMKNKPRYEFDYKIIEPYVCVKCKARKNINLEGDFFSGYSEKEVYDFIEELEKKYPLIRPRAIVENDINDYLLVDREYLAILEKADGPRLKI